MDENYLDNLLNEFSLDKEIDHKIEDEIDSQIENEKRQVLSDREKSKEDTFDLDLNKDADFSLDDDEILFSENQIEELDQLDNFADLDIGDLDFSDIDFDDIDVTKLDDIDNDNLDDILKDFESDIEIDESFDEPEKSNISEENINLPDESETNELVSAHEEDTVLADAQDESEEETKAEVEKEEIPIKEELNEDHFDADDFLDSLLEESEEEKAKAQPIEELKETTETDTDTTSSLSPEDDSSEAKQDSDQSDDLLNSLDPFFEEDGDKTVDSYDALGAMDGFSELGELAELGESDLQSDEKKDQLSKEETAELDDLFSMLDLDEVEETEKVNILPDEKDELDISILEDLDDIDEKPEKKKRGIMQILFGDPDEDDILSEEELAQIEAKKAAKIAKKQAAKEAKEEKAEALKEQKAAKESKKNQTDEEKKKLKAEKKAAQKAEELANAESEKKLNTPMIIFIFTLFLGGTLLFIVATNNFNYSQVIEKASKYFAAQKYRNAYDEISGVEVKEKDQELKDRIYTVMYVERLYESYENNIQLGREEKAIDSLLRGVVKYYEHYEEAKELGITSDLDYSFNQIQTALGDYGISLDRANEINQLENYDYVQAVKSYTNTSGTSEEGNTDNNEVISNEDAALPKEEEDSEQ